jgi:adenylate cyclase
MLNSSQPPRTEHERKFLVVVENLPSTLPKPKELVQGYLSYEPLQSRIRITDSVSAIHEFKGKNDLEIPTGNISVEEAEFLLEHYRLGRRVKKNRYVFPAGESRTFPEGETELLWELDIFLGKNAPLHLVEIELPSMDTPLPKDIPSWIGQEVTGEFLFKNKNLSVEPFDAWSEKNKIKTLKLMGL